MSTGRLVVPGRTDRAAGTRGTRGVGPVTWAGTEPAKKSDRARQKKKRQSTRLFSCLLGEGQPVSRREDSTEGGEPRNAPSMLNIRPSLILLSLGMIFPGSALA